RPLSSRHSTWKSTFNYVQVHDLAKFTEEQGFGARNARIKLLFLRCNFETFAKSCPSPLPKFWYAVS
ncbi:MAG: hypothetical protein AAGA75_14680, partial [Cyanobacteria bacterium P01_E01_bin.6]